TAARPARTGVPRSPPGAARYEPRGTGRRAARRPPTAAAVGADGGRYGPRRERRRTSTAGGPPTMDSTDEPVRGAPAETSGGEYVAAGDRRAGCGCCARPRPPAARTG